MRVFRIAAHLVQESGEWPKGMPSAGFVWMAFSRREFELLQQTVQRQWQMPQLQPLHLLVFQGIYYFGFWRKKEIRALV